MVKKSLRFRTRYLHALRGVIRVYPVSQDPALSNSNKIRGFAVCFGFALLSRRWQSVLTIPEEQMIENVLFVPLSSLFAC